MPIEWTIDREQEIARIRGRGPSTYLECRAAMLELVADPGFTSNIGLLCDFREFDYLPTKEDAHDLVEVVTRADVFRVHRIALVVVKLEAVGVAHQIAALAKLDGGTIGVFRDPVQATAWLRARADEAGRGH